MNYSSSSQLWQERTRPTLDNHLGACDTIVFQFHPNQGATASWRRSEVNKTQAVRDFLKANKKAKNADVVAALAEQGITITANYVGNIKATHHKKKRAMRKVVAKGGVGISEVKAALAFIKLTGSVAAAKKALEVAQEIRESCSGCQRLASVPRSGKQYERVRSDFHQRRNRGIEAWTPEAAGVIALEDAELEGRSGLDCCQRRIARDPAP